MADREVRVAHTEALFRDVNERIAESADRFNAHDAWRERFGGSIRAPTPSELLERDEAGVIELRVDLLHELRRRR